MKTDIMRPLLFFLLFMFGTSFANAQKYAYIDSDYILNKMPEYEEAKAKLDKMAERWTKEIEKLYDILNQKKDNFAREEVLLPCLLYTSPSPRDLSTSRMPSSA